MTEPATRFSDVDTLASTFESIYRGESPFGTCPPWEIGGPQPAFVTIEEAGLVNGAVTDPGCGTGDNALYMASKGYAVTGLDLSPTAIATARRRAEERGLDATFSVANVVDLSGYDGCFDTVLDSGMAHSLDPGTCQIYAAVLHRICRPGAVVHVLAVSPEGAEVLQERLAAVLPQIPAKLPEFGPRRTTAGLCDCFAEGWTTESITDATMRSILPTSRELIDVPAWLARFRRA